MMRKLAALLAVVPVAVFVIAMLGTVSPADARRNREGYGHHHQTPTVVSTLDVERNLETGGFIGYVVRMESAQRILGPFRLEDDCYSAARLLNGARPNAFACREERQ